MGLSLTHIILLLVVVLVIFGVGKLPQVMGDLGKGVRNFKSGLNEDGKPDALKPGGRLDQDAKFDEVKLDGIERDDVKSRADEAPKPPPML